MNEQVEALLRTLPRKVKVGAYDWRIKIEPGTTEENTYGLCDWEKNLITIWPDAIPSHEMIVGTVLHELLHVIYGDEELDGTVGDFEETIVNGFERGLIGLYRDNPKLLTWIKRGLKSTTNGRA